MKYIFVVGLSALILISVIKECVRQTKSNKALEEILKIISIFKSEIRYRKSDYSELMTICETAKLKYLKADDNFSFCGNTVNSLYTDDFTDFLNRIGTTDVEGQLSLCDEYSEKFMSYLKEGKEKEKTGGRVNLALSALGSLGVIVVFL